MTRNPDLRHFSYDDIMNDKRDPGDYVRWGLRSALALVLLGGAFVLYSVLFGADDDQTAITTETEVAVADTTTASSLPEVDTPAVLPNGRPINQPGAGVRPPRPEFDYPPAAVGDAFTGDNGTVFTTYAAPEEALGWMDSMTNIFHHPLPDDTPKVENSTLMAAYIDEIINGDRLYDYGSGFEEGGNAPYMLFVDSDRENFTEVVFRPQTCGDSLWWNWSSEEFLPFINNVYDDDRYGIPIPADFEMNPDDGDFHVMIYDYRQDIMFELWKTQTTNLTGRPGIEACWGGVLKDFSIQNGTFPFPTGVDAAGFTVAGLTITLEDVRRGKIEHAIGISTEIVLNNPDSADHSYPANRNDGLCTDDPAASTKAKRVTQSVNGAENCLYEGQYLRLPADYITDTIRHPFARMVAEAARDYGLVVHDIAGCFCLQSESSYPVTNSDLADEDPWLDVYDGATEFEIITQIDWSELEILPRDWDRPTDYQIPCAVPPNLTPDESPNLGDPRCQELGDPYSTIRP